MMQDVKYKFIQSNFISIVREVKRRVDKVLNLKLAESQK
jgi:hypothetical protein